MRKKQNENELKLNERIPQIKTLFEKIGIEITDEQAKIFLNTIEEEKEKYLLEIKNNYQEKIEEYQKRNFQLAVSLEETNQFKENLNKFIEEKFNFLNEISTNIENNIINKNQEFIKTLEENINKIKNFEKNLEKFTNIEKRINEKLLNFDVSEEIKKIQIIGKIFENYKKDFVDTLINKESQEINDLKNENKHLKKENLELKNEINKLKQQIIQERYNTEVSILLETSTLDNMEKEHFWKFYQKVGYEEGINEIKKFIERKQKQEKENPKSLYRESIGIKPTNELGILKKNKLIDSFSKDLEEWAILAGVTDSQKS